MLFRSHDPFLGAWPKFVNEFRPMSQDKKGHVPQPARRRRMSALIKTTPDADREAAKACQRQAGLPKAGGRAESGGQKQETKPEPYYPLLFSKVTIPLWVHIEYHQELLRLSNNLSSCLQAPCHIRTITYHNRPLSLPSFATDRSLQKIANTLKHFS